MMNTYLAQRLDEVLLQGKWIANTNMKDQITSITWKQATTRIGQLNSIALLTFHITYYLKGINQVFEGGKLDIKDVYSFDMQEVKSASDWEELKNDFLSNAEQFIKHVEKMDDKTLNSPFVKEEYGTYMRNIEGQIEHCYYHLGQISLLKKLILQ
jgi:uncharacterized damage-inducible protein DinB